MDSAPPRKRGRSWPDPHVDALLDVTAELKFLLNLLGDQSEEFWEQVSGLMVGRGLDYSAKRCQLKFHQMMKTFLQGQGLYGEPDRTLKFSSKMEALLDDRVQPHQALWPGTAMDNQMEDGSRSRDELGDQLDRALALRRELVERVNGLDSHISNLIQLKENAQQTVNPEKNWQLSPVVHNTAGASASSQAISVKDFPLVPASHPWHDQPPKEKNWQLSSVVQNTACASASSPTISVKDFLLLPAVHPWHNQPPKQASSCVDYSGNLDDYDVASFFL